MATLAPHHRLRLWLARRPLAYWTLVAGLAALVALLVARADAGARATRAHWGRTETVLVASRDLVPGDALDEAAAALVELPVAVVAPGTLTRRPAGAVVRSPVAAGEPIHPLRVGRGGASPVAALLPDGHRGVALPRAPGLPLATGDRVDVVGLAGTVATGTVVHTAEEDVVVAVPEAALAAVVAALAEGTAVVALAG